MEKIIQQSLKIMTERAAGILKGCEPSIILYGSLVLDDFRPGWSDIDILGVTNKPISAEQAEKLLYLRQELSATHNDNICYRAFEGAFLSLEGLRGQAEDVVVYWGTSGQRITTRYVLDPFARMQILEKVKLLWGHDIKGYITYPGEAEIITAVRRHYEAIRKYAVNTEQDIKSAGWIFDIARCIYTLETMRVIAKTKAGEWALSKKLCPDCDVLERSLQIRKNPLLFLRDNQALKWAGALGPYIQRFADVLQKELEKKVL